MLEHVLIGDAAVALLVLAVRGPLLFFLLPPLAARSVARRAPLRRAAGVARAPVGRARRVGLRLRRLAHPGRLRLRRRARVGARRRAPLVRRRGLARLDAAVDPAGRRTLSVGGRLAFAGALFAFGQVLSDVLLLAPQPLFPAYGDGTARAARPAARRARDDGRAAR